MLERDFQARLIKKLRDELPGCVVLKTDAGYLQGFPDLLILHGDRWAALETKRSANASRRPNQDFYISKLNEMSYANYVYPENEKEILNDIHKTFGTGRKPCISKPK